MRTSVVLFVSCLSLLLSACAEQETLTPKLWSVPTGGVSSSALNGNLIVGYLDELDDQIAAVDITEQRLVWRSAVGEGNSFSRGFAINEKAVFVFLRNKGLYVYDRQGEVLKQLVPPKEDGEEIGRASAGIGLLGSRFYIPNERRLYAYDVSNPGEPTLLWQRTLPNPIASLAVAPDGVYVGGVSLSPKANILKLSPVDGRELWQGDLQGFGQGVPSTQALAVAGEQVIAYSFEVVVHRRMLY